MTGWDNVADFYIILIGAEITGEIASFKSSTTHDSRRVSRLMAELEADVGAGGGVLPMGYDLEAIRWNSRDGLTKTVMRGMNFTTIKLRRLSLVGYVESRVTNSKGMIPSLV